MPENYSSAGLLYVYLNGFEEDGMICAQPIDSYRHIGEGLYDSIMEAAADADEEEQVIHMFSVVGPKEKADAVFSILEDGLRNNYQRLLSGQRIRMKDSRLDRTGNAFFRCIQEFYCDLADHYPQKVRQNRGDAYLNGIACSHMPAPRRDAVMTALASLWLEREAPKLCGRQLMTKSFFLRDFVGRKVISALPETETGAWRLIFDGGHQLHLLEDAPYRKDTLHPNDLGAFCSSNVESILLNPVYGYGKLFQPYDICEEWHKAFLYLCAVSDTKWNYTAIRRIYERFLRFLEKNICLTEKAPPLLSKGIYLEALLRQIAKYREFLSGDDEPVISKDLHQSLSSRFVYLPYLWPLVKPAIPQGPFDASELRDLIDRAIRETDNNLKGLLWEDVAAYVLGSIEGWKITGRRIKAGSQEIDLSIANISLDDELWQMGACVLVECKNWRTRVGIQQVRNIAHIINMKGSKTAILFAAGGITTYAQEEVERLAGSNVSVLCISAAELRGLCSAKDCKAMILEKWRELQIDSYRQVI